MKLFLDANILISVLTKEYPLFSSAAKVLSLADRPGFEVVTSPVCIAIAFYFASKKKGAVRAKKNISLLIRHIGVTTVDHECTTKALGHSQIHDLEDGIQYFSAIQSGCDYIISEDTGDFYFSEIPVMSASVFLSKTLKGH